MYVQVMLPLNTIHIYNFASNITNYTLYHEQGTNINIVFFVHDIPNLSVNRVNG